MFGVITNSISIGRYWIDVEFRDGVIRYRRFDGEELVKEMDLVGDAYLELVPIYPVFVPRFITQYILCIFRKPLVLAPYRDARIYMYLPIDFAVYARNHSMFKLVDVFTLDPRPKYILYGPTDHGIVARYCVTDYSFEELEPRFGAAVSQIIVRNNTKDFVTVNKVLFDASPLRLYYRPYSWDVYTQLIIMNITSSATATLHYENPFKDNLVVLDDPPDLKPPKIYNRTDMLWGY